MLTPTLLRAACASAWLLCAVAFANTNEAPLRNAAEMYAVALDSQNSYNALLPPELEAKVTLSYKVLIATSQAEYEQMLAENGAPAETAWSSGYAFHQGKIIFLKMPPPQNPARIRTFVWHEMTHVLQVELSNGLSVGNNVPQWVKEGMGNFFAGIIQERSGGRSFKSWLDSFVQPLRKAETYPSPTQVVKLNSSGWSSFNKGEGKGVAYPLATLMMAYGYQAKGNAIFTDMVNYLRCLGEGVAHQACFEKSFNMTLDHYAQESEAWIADLVAHPEKTAATEPM